MPRTPACFNHREASAASPASTARLQASRLHPGIVGAEELPRLCGKPAGPGDSSHGRHHFIGKNGRTEQPPGRMPQRIEPSSASHERRRDDRDRAGDHGFGNRGVAVEKRFDEAKRGRGAIIRERRPSPDERGLRVTGEGRRRLLRSDVVAEQVPTPGQREGAGRLPGIVQRFETIESRDDPACREKRLRLQQFQRGLPGTRTARLPQRPDHVSLGEQLPTSAVRARALHVTAREVPRGPRVRRYSIPGIEQQVDPPVLARCDDDRHPPLPGRSALNEPLGDHPKCLGSGGDPGFGEPRGSPRTSIRFRRCRRRGKTGGEPAGGREANAPGPPLQLSRSRAGPQPCEAGSSATRRSEAVSSSSWK